MIENAVDAIRAAKRRPEGRVIVIVSRILKPNEVPLVPTLPVIKASLVDAIVVDPGATALALWAPQSASPTCALAGSRAGRSWISRCHDERISAFRDRS